MTYKVTKQFGTNRELDSGQFKTLPEAKKYVQQQVQADAAMKVKSIYRIYEWDDLIEESHSDKIVVSAPSGNSDDSHGGKGSGAKPSPLSTVPRPPGSPQTWQEYKNDDEEGNK